MLHTLRAGRLGRTIAHRFEHETAALNSQTEEPRPRRQPRRFDKHSLRSLNGKKIERTLPRAFGRATYGTSFKGFEKPTCSDDCASFLDQLLGVILSRPAYIHPSDVCRYASLVYEFSTAEVSDPHAPSKPASPVATMPIEQLDVALNAWIKSYVAHQADSLLPTFVLDAARLIQAHAWGESLPAEEAEWKLEPMIAGKRGQHIAFPDHRMMHDISSSVSKLMVSLVIPHGCRVRQSDGKLVRKEGDLALFSPLAAI